MVQEGKRWFQMKTSGWGEVESDVVGVETMAFGGMWRSPESRGRGLPAPGAGPVAALEELGRVGSTMGSVEK